MKEPLVYIIILNWNGHEDTIECINSLLKITYKNYQIVIVDNASTNDSVKAIKANFPKSKYNNIKLIENNKNYGFAGGCNFGIKYALLHKADYVLLLNNDTIVDRNFLEKLVKSAEKGRMVGIVSPIIYYADKKNVIWFTGALKKKDRLISFKDLDNKKIDKGQFKNIKEVDCVWGCSMLIRIDVFAKVGYLDEEYFLYMEDIDLCLRVKKLGYKILFVPQAKIWHKVSGSSGGEASIRQRYYNSRNTILLARKTLEKESKFNFYYYYFRDKLNEMVNLIRAKNYKHAQILLKGLFHGLQGKRGHYNI